jgi:hypothetical protein
MSRVIQSPIAKFPGKIILSDPITLPQAIAVEDAIQAGKNLLDEQNDLSIRKYNAAILPGILKCVEKIEIAGLENVTAETWPATPPMSAAKLTAWLIDEVIKALTQETDVPNE